MSGGNKGVSSSSSIPASSRKMVQSLKEIVSYSEHEIYAMLKECNMDPNETVDRLLSQDRFHEVKSKREKKKESKDTPDSRSRGAGIAINRGGRGGTDRYVERGGSSQFASTGAFNGKSAYKKENGTYAHTNSSYSAPRMAGNNMNHLPLSLSDSVPKENIMSTMGVGDGTFSSSQPSGFQPTWAGVPGKVSMADIVKMGRPHGKASSTVNQSHHSVHDHLMVPPSAALHQDWHSSQDYASNLSEETGVVSNQHVPPNDEFPLVEQPPAAGMSSVIEEPLDSNHYADSSSAPFDRTNQNLELQIDEVQVQEANAGKNSNANFVRSGSASSRSVQEDDLGSASHYDNDMYHNTSSYQHNRHAFQHHEVEDGGASLSSIAANLQQLSLQKDEQGAPPEEDDHSVVIPNHLQVHSADCSHLSFGSFGSSTSAVFSAPFTSMPLKSDVEEVSTIADDSSFGHSNSRNPEFYGDEHLITSSYGNLVHRASASNESYDSNSASQPEVLKQDTPEEGQGNQYVFPSSVPSYTFENSQQLNAAAYTRSSSQMQNIAPLSNVMHAYTNSLPSSMLASTVQPVRESDLPNSPFPVSQSMPTKYNTAVSPISGSTIPMPEGLKTGYLSAHQPSPETLPSGNVATGPALPQHLAVHPYSQPTLPLGHFANMIGYPYLPQSYTYMPSAFQQTFGGNSSYHQSLAAVLPQYKNNISVSSLPQSAAIASGYGAFGSSRNVPGSFPLNPPPPAAAAAAGTTIGYDESIISQYKDASQLLSLQQNDNSAMWVHGPGSRTMSAVPSSTYYSFQGQNQQPAGFRQGQQPSQHFGAHGYPNFYHSQTGMSLEHQQQNLRDGSLSGSQGQPAKQSQQMWQNNY